MAGALYGVLERAMPGHQVDGMIQVGAAGIAFLEGAPPERSFALRPAPERQHDGQRDLSLAEIIADILPELGGGASVVEGIVDQLEGDAEIHSERAAGGLLVSRTGGERGADLAGGSEQLCSLGTNNREIV